jgi:hypothetical protein
MDSEMIKKMQTIALDRKVTINQVLRDLVLHGLKSLDEIYTWSPSERDE